MCVEASSSKRERERDACPRSAEARAEGSRVGGVEFEIRDYKTRCIAVRFGVGGGVTERERCCEKRYAMTT